MLLNKEPAAAGTRRRTRPLLDPFGETPSRPYLSGHLPPETTASTFALLHAALPHLHLYTFSAPRGQRPLLSPRP